MFWFELNILKKKGVGAFFSFVFLANYAAELLFVGSKGQNPKTDFQL